MKYLYFADAGCGAAWAAEFLHCAYSSPPGAQRLVNLVCFGIMICCALASAAKGIAETLKDEVADLRLSFLVESHEDDDAQ